MPPRRRPGVRSIPVNGNTPLSLRPRARRILGNRRGGGLQYHNFTLVHRGLANVPAELSNRQLFNVVRRLVTRPEIPNRNRVSVTFSFVGDNTIRYRTMNAGRVFGTRNSDVGYRRFLATLRRYREQPGPSGELVDDDGNPLSLLSNTFDLYYGTRANTPALPQAGRGIF